MDIGGWKISRFGTYRSPDAIYGSVVADPAQKIVAVYQHCCLIQQITIARYDGALPQRITRERLPLFTFAGFRLGEPLNHVIDAFGMPISKANDLYTYVGPLPDSAQGCSREFEFKFLARRLRAVTITQGC